MWLKRKGTMSLCRPPVRSRVESGGSVLLRPTEAACGGCISCCPAWMLIFSTSFPKDLREKNWKAMEALASSERAFEEKLRSLTQAKVRCPSLDLPGSENLINSTCVV